MDVKEENLDELLEKAELEAAGDEVVSSGRNLSDSDNENEEKENPYLVEFSREYDWLNDKGEMEKISSLDLSGLVDLTTIDGEYFDRLLIKVGHRPQNKFTDFTYCKYVAMHVTNRPAEFFNAWNKRHDDSYCTYKPFFYVRAGLSDDWAVMLSKTAMRLALATNSGIEYIKKVPVIDFLRIYEDLLEIVRGEE